MAFKKVNRRTFVEGATAMAAAAALGAVASEGVRRHGPVRIQTYLLTKDPIVMGGSLLADGRRDLFRIYARVEPKAPPVIVEMSLRNMRKAVEIGSGRLLITVKNPHETTWLASIGVMVDQKNVTFLFGKGDPVWLPLSDVKKVI